MEISNAKPFDESRSPRDVPARPAAQRQQEVGQNTSPDTEAPTEAPEGDGVLGSSQVQGGSVRDPTDPQQTKDHVGAAARLAELVKSLRKDSGFPGSTRLAIDVDEDTYETTFLVLNRETGEVVRRIPEEEFLPLLRELALRGGLIFDRKF